MRLQQFQHGIQHMYTRCNDSRRSRNNRCQNFINSVPSVLNQTSYPLAGANRQLHILIFKAVLQMRSTNISSFSKWTKRFQAATIPHVRFFRFAYYKKPSNTEHTYAMHM